MSIKNVSFLILALGPKMSKVAHVSLSSSLCLNSCHIVLHGWPPSSLSKPPWPELFKLITSNHAPLPKSSQNQITTTTMAKTQPKSNRNKNPEAHQITNQITPTEIKAQNPQNNQNHKMKTLKLNPTLKKNIYWFCYYILEEESSCWTNFRFKLIKHILILHRISRLNASTSVDYGWWRKAYKTNTKSERESEWTDQTPSDG